MASTPASRFLSREKLAGWVPQFTDLAKHSPSFDTLTATVVTLRDALSRGHLRSAQLVVEYQRSICLHNEWLGAVYQLTPGAMDRAREMDALRQEGKVLGALHGIPILVKVGGAARFEMSIKNAIGKYRYRRSFRLRGKCGSRRSDRVQAKWGPNHRKGQSGVSKTPRDELNKACPKDASMTG